MKTKFRVKAIIFLLVLMAAVTFSSCSDHNEIGSVQPIGNGLTPVKQVFMPQAVNNPLSKILLVIDTTYTYKYGAAFNGTDGPSPAPSDINVKFSVDQTSADNFNAANSSSFSVVPGKNYKLSHTTATISAGERNTSTFNVMINPSKGRIKQQKYLMPISVQSVGGDIGVFQSLQTTYFVLNFVYPKVYIPQAQNNPIKETITIENKDFTYDYGAAYKELGKTANARSKIDLKFKVDPSMVSVYNNQNSTSYSILPGASYTLAQTTASIQQGGNSTPAFKLTVNPSKGTVGHQQYLLPITLVSENPNVKVDTDLQTAYFLFKGVYPPISKAGWKITDVDSEHPPGYGAVQAIDGSTSTFWNTDWENPKPLPHHITVDMGGSHTMRGFTLNGRLGLLAFEWQQNPKDITLKFSDDGMAWKNAENFTIPFSSSMRQAKIFLSQPVTARYFKLIINSNVGESITATNFAEITAF